MMKKTEGSYGLIHLCSGGDFKIPLVSSQLYDQAQWQYLINEDFSPQKIGAWAIEPMRELFNKSSKSQIKALKSRCPDIDITLIGGINRLKNFPALEILKYKRKKLGLQIPVIYHCRGESVIPWAVKLKEKFPQDKIVLDVRGFWPAELLYKRNIQSFVNLKENDLRDYTLALAKLKNAIQIADIVTTVSDNLRHLLIKDAGASETTYVVPCCVAKITDDTERNIIRKRWGIKDTEKVLVYAGGTAKYQHLEDLTFPFVKKLMNENDTIRLVLLTTEMEKMKNIVEKSALESSRILIESCPQEEVASMLTGGDIGLLIRQPTIVNQVAHPVKINEYLASGLSIIAEEGLGGISKDLIDLGLVKLIHTTNSNTNSALEIKEVNDWIRTILPIEREKTRNVVKKNYLWSSSIKVHRNAYKKLLN